MVDTLSRMRQLIGTTAQWAANNIVLGDGELGVEVIDTNTRRMKVGDGSRTWSALPYTSITQGALDSEAAARAAADATLQTNINSEASTRSTADSNEATTRATNDTTEVNARIAAVSGEATTRGNADTTLQTNINSEQAARIAADTAEATTRGNADTAETNARTAADTTLQTNINNEANARTAGDNLEITARTNADNALDIRIDVLEAGAAGTAADIAALETSMAVETAARTDNDAALDRRLVAIEDQHLDQRVSTLENQSASLPPPPWVRRAVIGGVEKVARFHARFSSNEFWCDGIRNFDYLIAYTADSRVLRCDDDGVFRYSEIDEPIISALGLKYFRSFTNYVRYNRDLRINWRISYTGMAAGEFLTDGDLLTFSGGGSGRYIAGEQSIILLTGWTGAAPVQGQIITGPNCSLVVGSSVAQFWIHENVTVTRNQIGLDGQANTACLVTATAANGRVYQSISATMPGTTRRSVCFMYRKSGTGEIALGIDGAIFDPVPSPPTPTSLTGPLWGRFASNKQPMTNAAIPGIRIATSGNAVVVDFVQALERGPTQAECYQPGWTSGLGTNEMPMETGNLQLNMADSQAWCRRAFDSFIGDVTRFTAITRLTTLTADPGGTAVQLDVDGTDKSAAIQNYSTVDTGSNNNFGVTYRTPANPAGFGNDPDGPKATANVAHTVAWTMNANDVGSGMAMAMIAADGSAARVNVAHPPDHFPQGLRFMRLGNQWATNMNSLSPAYNQGNAYLTELAIFDGVPSATELEALAPGSQTVP